MKTKLFKFIISFLTILVVLAIGQPVLAHGDEPRLEISAESLNPGAILEIRGVDFEFEEEIALLLVGPQSELSLGSVIADAEGVFQLGITLPIDLMEGTYFVRATTDDHVIESPLIAVWGSAQLGGGEEGAWEEGDGLLAPMPTVSAVQATPVSQVELPVDAAPEPEQNRSFIWILVILGGLLLVVILRFVKT